MTVGQVLEIAPNLQLEVSRQFLRFIIAVLKKSGTGSFSDSVNKIKYPPNTVNNHKKQIIQRR